MKVNHYWNCVMLNGCQKWDVFSTQPPVIIDPFPVLPCQHNSLSLTEVDKLIY